MMTCTAWVMMAVKPWFRRPLYTFHISMRIVESRLFLLNCSIYSELFFEDLP